jgi:hypothetical protein
MPFFFFLTGCSKASSSLFSSVVWICKWWVWSFFSFAADYCMCEVIYAIGSCPTHIISLGNNNHNSGSTGYVRARTQQSKASNPIRQMLDSGWWMWCSHGDNEIISLSLHFGSTLNATSWAPFVEEEEEGPCKGLLHKIEALSRTVVGPGWRTPHPLQGASSQDWGPVKDSCMAWVKNPTPLARGFFTRLRPCQGQLYCVIYLYMFMCMCIYVFIHVQ